MIVSPKGIAFVKGYEKCAKAIRGKPGQFAAYMPTPDDVPTIGWGSTGPDIKMGLVWSQAQCDSRFDADAQKFAHAVDEALGGTATTQGQFDAMWSLAYNIGVGGFKGSTVLRQHKAGNYDKAASAFAMWNKQKGKVLDGLTKRRKAETAIYRGDDV